MSRINSLRLGSVIAVGLLVGGCVPQKTADTAASSAMQERLLGPGTLAIKNVFEYSRALSSATGVSMTKTFTEGGVGYNLAQTTEFVAPWLSTDGSAMSVNGTQLQSVASLASTYCIAFAVEEKAKAGASRKAFNQLNFAGSASQLYVAGSLGALGPINGVSPVSSGSNKLSPVAEDVISRLANLFFKRALAPDEKAVLSDAVVGLAEEANARSLGVQDVAVSSCILFAASPDFYRI